MYLPILLVAIYICLPFSESLHEYQIDKLDKEYEKWLSTYKAEDPAYQEYCMNILSSKSGSSSQFGQDIFIFFNLFKYYPMQGRTGFYVDSGANMAETLSNTFFYDKCLSWKGLCVEPHPKYHEELAKKRSCILVPECISDTEKKEVMSDNGVDSSIIDKEVKKFIDVQCRPLEAMLKMHGSDRNAEGSKTENGVYHVDFWSLDVEGYEMTILKSLDFEKVKVDVMLVEEYHISTRNLDRLMTDKSFYKFQQMPIDVLYTRRDYIDGHEGRILSANVWYPDQWEEWWTLNDDYRVEQGICPCA